MPRGADDNLTWKPHERSEDWLSDGETKTKSMKLILVGFNDFQKGSLTFQIQSFYPNAEVKGWSRLFCLKYVKQKFGFSSPS